MWRSIVLLLVMSATATASPEQHAHEVLGRSSPHCALDPITEARRLVIIGAASPIVLTNILFAGMDDEASLTAVSVEPGVGKLTVAVFADDNVIYAFDDPQKRIERLLLITSAKKRVGVTGLTKETVEVVDFSACSFPETSQVIGDAAIGNKIQLGLLGSVFARKPEVVALSDAILVALPSGARQSLTEKQQTAIYIEGPTATRRYKVEFDKDGKERRLPSEVFSKAEFSTDLLLLMDSHPGGLRRLDPDAVISTSKFARSARIPVDKQ
jgi:hypothetical protein